MTTLIIGLLIPLPGTTLAKMGFINFPNKRYKNKDYSPNIITFAKYLRNTGVTLRFAQT